MSDDSGTAANLAGAGGDTSRTSCEDQFAQSLQHTLEQSGEMEKLKAAVRSTILKVIRGDDRSPINKVREKYRSPAVDLCNGLVVDFLHWCGYHYSMEMFVTESGTPMTPEAPDRPELARRLEGRGNRLLNGDDDVPVLLAMVVHAMKLEEKSN